MLNYIKSRENISLVICYAYKHFPILVFLYFIIKYSVLLVEVAATPEVCVVRSNIKLC